MINIYIRFERRSEYALYTVRGFEARLDNCRYMIVRLDSRDESGWFLGNFMGYASGRSLNQSGFVESSTLPYVCPYANGIYRDDDNNELTLVGYITRENLRTLYRHSTTLGKGPIPVQGAIDVSPLLVIGTDIGGALAAIESCNVFQQA
ncbi:7941_t:CDS:2 [Acaulospora morrowiae]|uniref:7941_t:CDS:1 n=1 Tax=Acaulospora morrowiae TaxID=94023 RepID=A0A9N9ADR4_9GLOM|nr:7941_t:CDS:2 [Acaulospora morrowiae]